MTVSQSFATGNVIASGTISVTRTYAYGTVTYTDVNKYGGVVGSCQSGAPAAYVSLSNNRFRYATPASCTAAQSGSAQLTAAQMKQSANFAGWDFASVWNVTAGTTAPVLRAKLPTTYPAPSY